MQQADLDQVADIEQRSGLSPWGQASFIAKLSDPDAVALVAQFVPASSSAGSDNRVAGFLNGNIAADEFEIYSLAILPELRRQHAGTRLLSASLELAAFRGAVTAFLEVRSGNSSAISFYQKQGFVIVGSRPGYYQSPPEDALLMRRAL